MKQEEAEREREKESTQKTMIYYRQGINQIVYPVCHGGKGLTSTSDTNCIWVLLLRKKCFQLSLQETKEHTLQRKGSQFLASSASL